MIMIMIINDNENDNDNEKDNDNDIFKIKFLVLSMRCVYSNEWNGLNDKINFGEPFYVFLAVKASRKFYLSKI